MAPHRLSWRPGRTSLGVCFLMGRPEIEGRGARRFDAICLFRSLIPGGSRHGVERGKQPKRTRQQGAARRRRRPLADARPGAGQRVLRAGLASRKHRASLDGPVAQAPAAGLAARPAARCRSPACNDGAVRFPRPHRARPAALARLPRPGDLLRGAPPRARTASAPSPRSCSTGSATRPGRTASAASSIRGRCAPAAAASSPSPATARWRVRPAGLAWARARHARRRGARRPRLRAGRPLDPLSHQRRLPGLGAARCIKTIVIGAHNFYRLPGAGRRARRLQRRLCRQRAAAAPVDDHAPRSAVAAVLAGAAPPSDAGRTVRPPPAPSDIPPDPRWAPSNLPDSTVREEYRQSGQWRADAPAAITGR